MVSRGRWVAESPIRCGGCSVTLLEALQGEGEVGATLGAGYGVDLVHDHPAHRLQDRRAPPR